MSYTLLYLHALARWALEWARMDLMLAHIWISEHALETIIALLLIALLFAVLECFPVRENQED